jgi:hypothetical protein
LTVSAIKESVGLDPRSTHTEMMDWDISRYRTAIERLARLLNIRIEFHYVRGSKPVLFDVNDPFTPVPRLIVNEDSPNVVPIAFTGGHFELIVSGPNLEPLIRFERSRNSRPSVRSNSNSRKLSVRRVSEPESKLYDVDVFKPKLFEKVSQTYMTHEDFSRTNPIEFETLQAYETIANNKMLLEYYNEQLKLQTRLITEVKQSLASIDKSDCGLTSEDKESLSRILHRQYDMYVKNVMVLTKTIEKLKDENATLNQYVKTL